MNSSTIEWSQYLAAVWRTNRAYLKPVKDIDFISLESLIGIERQVEAVCRNTEQFLAGEEANHVLLWGARGMGKSSIIKGLLAKYHKEGLRVIEIPKDDLVHLLDICDDIRELAYKFIIFCDDLSFEEGDASYKALKSTLEGTIESPPKNILVYATSNRRHLLPERMSDNQSREIINGEIHQSDAVEEKMSLSDRFGLSLSFYSVDQETYLNMVEHYFGDMGAEREKIHKESLRFATQKGIRSGRVAKQFHAYYRNQMQRMR